MQEDTSDFNLQNYHYDLDASQIAQHPGEKREKSRLLVYKRRSNEIYWSYFEDILEYIPAKTLIVGNNSKVIPARLFGHRADTKGKAEFLLLTPLPVLVPEKADHDWQRAEVEGVLKISTRLRSGIEIEFSSRCRLIVSSHENFGRIRAELFWIGNLQDILSDLGHIPLPPYIQRTDTSEDRERYQTVYAREEKAGSVAAPTAGLHFTYDLLRKIKSQGFKWTEVTLYVGYGTFSPIRSQDIRKHQMHPEFIEISRAAAENISRARMENCPVLAIGTTTIRFLESVANKKGSILPFRGWTEQFIYPGYTFQAVDHLITNFHLPQSSLMLMLSALVGRKKLLDLYRQALNRGFSFFSYGDAMLVL